jgi:hypothetical protein
LKESSGKKKSGTVFVIATYIETVRHEQQLLLDGVARMMDKRSYIAWMAKPKNGCLPADEAAAKWLELYNSGTAVTDSSGPVAKYKDRVAVHVADEVRNRDAYIRSQGVEYKGKEIKNASQEDIDKLEARMAKGSVTKSTVARGRLEMSKAMVAAAAASQHAGEREVFSGVGLVAQVCPDVKVCFC